MTGPKHRRRGRFRRIGGAVVALVTALVAGACEAPPARVADGFDGRPAGAAATGDAAASGTLVLADPRDEARARSIDVAMGHLAGRLDASLGAPARSFTYTDATATWVLDQQFSWNGRIYDSYVNTRRTYRRASE